MEVPDTLLIEIHSLMKVNEQQLKDLCLSVPTEIGRMESAQKELHAQIIENRRYCDVENEARKDEINRLTAAQIGDHRFMKGLWMGAGFVVSALGWMLAQAIHAGMQYVGKR